MSYYIVKSTALMIYRLFIRDDHSRCSWHACLLSKCALF